MPEDQIKMPSFAGTIAVFVFLIAAMTIQIFILNRIM